MKNKKLLSTVMAVCMAFSILPTVSLAAEGADGIVDYAMLDDAAIADGDAVYDMEENADDGAIAEYSLGEESGDLYAASISWPATKNIKTYVISTKNDTVVYQTATSKTKYGTIYATDLITINGYSGSRLKVTYPVSGGTKTGYIDKSKVTSSSINVAKSKYTATAKTTTYRRTGGGTELGYISKGDTVYTIATSGSYTQVIYPISGGYKMGWIKTSDIPTTNTGGSSSSYTKKAEAFLSDSRWKNGATWSASQKPKLSTYSATGCCAYAVDFCKYVFGKNSYTSGTKFTNPSDIKAGDVIKVTNSQHWFVVISRSGNSLKVAEGNWAGKVVVTNGTYTVKDNKLYRSGKVFRTFSAGYHMQ